MSLEELFKDKPEPEKAPELVTKDMIIGDILKTATPETMESLKKLLQGGQVTTYVDTGVIYPEILHNPSSIYSFLK